MPATQLQLAAPIRPTQLPSRTHLAARQMNLPDSSTPAKSPTAPTPVSLHSPCSADIHAGPPTQPASVQTGPPAQKIRAQAMNQTPIVPARHQHRAHRRRAPHQPCGDLLGAFQPIGRCLRRRALLGPIPLPLGRHLPLPPAAVLRRDQPGALRLRLLRMLAAAASAAHFFGTVPALPYCMAVDCPCECVYTLGHYRPGSCPPWRWHWPPCEIPAIATEAAVLAGLILIFP